MRIHGLPDDILRIVLRKSLHRGSDKLEAFKSNLVWLSVCQRWRGLAIPMVYSNLYVQFGERIVRKFGADSRDRSGEEPTDAAIKTNLDLISAVGCTSMARSADIAVGFTINPIPGFRKVAERLRIVSSEWKRITTLNVFVFPDTSNSSIHRVDVSGYSDHISEVSDVVAALMPDVCQLNWKGSNYSRIANALHGELARRYYKTLEEIDSMYPIVAPSGRRFERLKKLNICNSIVSDNQYPNVNAGELEKLTLRNVPSDHSWASFSSNNDGSVIEFAKLNNLTLAYNSVYKEEDNVVQHRDGHPWTLQLPALGNLSITCYVNICPLFEYMVLPPRMRTIFIGMPLEAYQRIAHVALATAESIVLKVNYISQYSPSGFAAINRILESARGSDEVGLDITDSGSPILPEFITCTALTRLCITASTNVDTMLGFFQHLPNLTKLVVHNLMLDDIQSDLSIPDASSHTPVEPLDTKLNILAINYNKNQYSPDMAVAVAKYMLLKVPMLAQFNVAQIPRQPIVDFVETFAQWYPHLSNDWIKVYEGREYSGLRWML
ncbi:hypothetical protein LPJ61_004597 [Coemansia biformis]|uniref:Uncharacterized protein n=1 Tax=Coemansia biformis TaxID=1286918 RepID=A0A9W7Y4J3_9FUNG|nr:hypothetical protein LPJ61_004597 [Coemansia biformis]